MKRTALLAVFVMLLAPQSFAGTWLKSIDAAQKVAKQKKQLIFVDLFAEWCGWCHRFEQEVFPSMVFQTATNDMVLLRLDTEDRGEGTKFAQKFQVTSLPTFLVLTPELTVAGIIKGYAPPNDFVKMLKDTRGKHEAFLDKVKNEAKLKDPFERLEMAREFLKRSDYAKAESRFKKLTTEKGIPASVRDSAYYDLAVAYILQKKYGDSMAAVKALTSLSKAGEPVERARLLAGQIYMEQGNLVGARDEFREFKRLFPNSALVRNVDMVLPDLERRVAAAGTK